MVTKLVFAALVSILVAFVIAASEASLSRISRHRAGELFEEARRGASALATILSDSAAYLSVASFVRVAAEATTAVLITLAVVDVVDGFWPDLLISIGVMVVVSFVIVGVSPRTLAASMPTGSRCSRRRSLSSCAACWVRWRACW